MVDLNLFRVFDAMMQDRTVRAASRRLSVTPSAVSHALRRLRQSLRDELFVSTESSMQPTRRALEIAPTIRLHGHSPAAGQTLERERSTRGSASVCMQSLGSW